MTNLANRTKREQIPKPKVIIYEGEFNWLPALKLKDDTRRCPIL